MDHSHTGSYAPWDTCFFMQICISILVKNMFFLFNQASQLRTHSYLQWQPTPAKPRRRWANCAPPYVTPNHGRRWFKPRTLVTPIELRCSISWWFGYLCLLWWEIFIFEFLEGATTACQSQWHHLTPITQVLCDQWGINENLTTI